MPRTFSLRARYLLTMQGAAVENGLVTIHDGYITGMGKSDRVAPLIDLGDVILMPGLVNAHTHLEFSDLTTPLPAGDDFTDWIRSVIAYRQQQRAVPSESVADGSSPLEGTVERGLRESVQSGVTTIGEISTVAGTHDWYQQTEIGTVLFQEVLGLSSEQIPNHIRAAEQHVGEMDPATSLLAVGLSPHAPYSVHCELFQQVCQLAARSNVPCALHLAESTAELELLQSGSGPMQQMLESLNAWDSSAIPRGMTPLDYLRWMSDTPRSLIIHGNFLTSVDYNFLAEHADRMSLIYCPRTYGHFHDVAYPLQSILDHGVLVALGTDSRATNPDLNLLAELQHVAQTHPSVAPYRIVQMGTRHAAQALGLETSRGSIEVGKRADLITICCDHDHPTDLAEAVTAAGSSVESVMCGGQWLIEPPSA